MRDRAAETICSERDSHLQVDVWDILAKGYPCRTINDLYSDGRIAFGLQSVVHQVLWCKVDIAPPVRVVLAQNALWVQAAQTPVI